MVAVLVIVLLVVGAAVAYSLGGTNIGEPSLKMNVVPPGYPVVGSTWAIQVWQPDRNGTLVPAKNASVLIEPNVGPPYQIQTDTNGQVSLTYTNSYGKVTIVAIKSGFAQASYTPIDSFVSTDTAWQAVGAFWTASALSGTVLVKFRRKMFSKGKTLATKAAYILGVAVSLIVVAVLIIGLSLTFVWVSQFGNGTAYGFPSSIALGLVFNPHLLALLFTLVGGTIFLGVVGYFRPDDVSGSNSKHNK